ncbi:MAG: hypothetical protein C5B49_08660 [Bdellovibrio sp.]|nr:MAG: hypothetical protein C5B49_08660 [Bdellovibrio sp.]
MAFLIEILITDLWVLLAEDPSGRENYSPGVDWRWRNDVGGWGCRKTKLRRFSLGQPKCLIYQ